MAANYNSGLLTVSGCGDIDKSFLGAKNEVPYGVHYALNLISPQEVEGGVAEASECMAARRVANAAMVFAEIHVAKVVEGFNAPVLAPVREKCGGVGQAARETGDSIDYLDGFFAIAFGRAGELAGLS